MEMRILEYSIIIFFAFLVILPTFVYSTESDNISLLLNESEKDMYKMMKDGLPIERYNDTLFIAKDLFLAQKVIGERGGGKPDFSAVKEKISELETLKTMAYKANDELIALEITINQTQINNLTEVLKLYKKAKIEFLNERYEKCLKIIEQTYEKISEMEAFETKVKAFYEVTSMNIRTFLISRWKEILLVVIIIITIYYTTHKRVECMILKRKMKNLERRKVLLKELMAQTQRDYFDKGKISETTYHIRIKKYAEIMRDINRQIPLIKEEIYKKEINRK